MGLRARPLHASVRRRFRLSWLQALMVVGATTALVIVAGALLIRVVEPERYRDVGSGLWFALVTITTVGYADAVPRTGAGRLLAAGLMVIGIGCYAFLTAVAASAIAVEDLAEEERQLRLEENRILEEIEVIDARLRNIEKLLDELAERIPVRAAGPDR